ncbi:MAG: hypothetical protein Q9165_000376 [Trypethelium subeluteriae]
MALFDNFPSTSSSSTLTIVALIASTVIGIFLFLLNRPALPLNAPPYSHLSYPIVGALKFWSARWDFFSESAARSRSGHFSYYIGKYPVVGLMGEEGRKTFLESKQLNLDEGYGYLFVPGPAPLARFEDEGVMKPFWSYFSKRLLTLLRTERLVPLVKVLSNDIDGSLERLRTQARSGKNVINPYDTLYDIIFQLTLRAMGCTEIAADPQKRRQLLGYYATMDRCITRSSVLFPWLPTLSLAKWYWSAFRMFSMFNRVIEDRKKQGRREDDALQYMLDCGETTERIVMFVSGSMFAGVFNATINAGAMLAFLAHQPEWQNKVRKEMNDAIEKYAAPDTKGRPVEERLASLPLEIWESKFPAVDLCVKESIRLNLMGCGYRRNISDKPIEIPGSKGEVIPAGHFATYHLADIHMDPYSFPEPQNFDPARFLPGREEDKKSAYGWIGWGAGRHPCLGMRFAKLELTLATVFLLSTFDWELCNDRGGPEPRGLPGIDLRARAPGPPEKIGLPKRSVYVKYTPRNEA